PSGHLGGRLLQRPDACAGRMGEHAHRARVVGDRRRSRRRGDMAGLFRPASRSNEMKRSALLPVLSLCAVLAACDAADTAAPQYGAKPELPDPQRGLLPDMTVAEPAQWGDQRPTVPQGYTISAIATDLQIPRQTLLLPNGD